MATLAGIGDATAATQPAPIARHEMNLTVRFRATGRPVRALVDPRATLLNEAGVKGLGEAPWWASSQRSATRFSMSRGGGSRTADPH